MLFRLVKLTAIFIQLILFLFIRPELSFSLTKEEELEIQKLISIAVSNTSWLYSTSQEELIILLNIFTEEYCREKVYSILNFTSKPTGWEYLYFLGCIKIEDNTSAGEQEDNTLAHAVIIEYDPLFSLSNIYNLDFELIKVNGKWKIKNINCPEYG